MPKKPLFLQKLAKKEPDYVNTEYVYPCKVKDVVYKNPLCEKDSQLFSFVQNHLKTIVTPHGYKALSQKVAPELIDVFTSLYENGRVLESKDTITIDGKPYVMTMKGVGTTMYYRTTGAINPYMTRDGYKIDPLEQKLLSIFPYVDDAGLLPLKSALIEKDNALWLEELGIDAEKVLAINTYDQVMGPNGDYIDVASLEQDGIISQGKEPCILTRISKSNIRLLDIIMMKEYHKKQLIIPTIEEILRIAKIHRGVSNINEYLAILIDRVFTHRLTLSQYCHTINGEKWQDITRNITILGEEVDLVTIKKHQSDDKNPHDFIRNYERQIENIEDGIRSFIGTIEETGLYNIDHQRIADAVRETVGKYLVSYKREEIHTLFKKQGRHKRYSQDYNHEQAFTAFYNSFIRRIFSFVLDYVPQLGYAKILHKELTPILK